MPNLDLWPLLEQLTFRARLAAAVGAIDYGAPV